jgi:excisionase family DNA binding protein
MALKDDYFTLSEFAARVGVTRQTASRWLKDGKVVGERVGREVLIPKDELQKCEDKFGAMIGETIIKIIIKAIREELHYFKKDRIEPISYDKDEDVIQFSVVRKDGTRDKVQTRIMEISEEEPIMKLAITKIQNEK